MVGVNHGLRIRMLAAPFGALKASTGLGSEAEKSMVIEMTTPGVQYICDGVIFLDN